MKRFWIKLPFRILVLPVWLAVTVIKTIGIFLLGVASWIFYLIAGVAVIVAVSSVGFQLYTWSEVRMHFLCAAVFVLIPNMGIWMLAGMELLQCRLRSFIFE